MKSKINQFIKRVKCEEILKLLVKAQTTNPPGNEMNLIQSIMNLFPTNSIKYNILDHGGNRGSLVITIPGKQKNKSIAFIGHLDTVPVTNEKEWLYPPFDATIDGDYLYGRGSADMKGGLASMIITALYFIQNNIQPMVTVKFCFTADEESGGIGVVAMREAGYFDDVVRMIIPEPTNDQIGLGEKGALWLRISATGKSAHGSRPELGCNAIEHLLTFINTLNNSLSLISNNPLLGTSSIQVTQFNGGSKTNIIPDKGEVTLDIRTVPGNDHNSIIETARSIAKNITKDQKDIEMDVQVENNRPAVMTNEDAKIVQELKSVYDMLSIKPETKGIQFYTDASQVVPQLNIPFVIMGPGEEEMAHQKNERIAIASVEKMALIYVQYILNKN